MPNELGGAATDFLSYETFVASVLLQLSGFRYLTEPMVEEYLFGGSSLTPLSRQVITRRDSRICVAAARFSTAKSLASPWLNRRRER